MSPGASWTFLGTFLGAFWERLGACGRFLEPFGSHSGSLVESSGKLLGTFWELCWSVWEPSGSLLGTFWERSGSLLEPSGNFSGCFLGAFCEVSRSLLGTSWSISRKQILRQKYIGRIATKGKKRRVFIGSKQGRHPTRGKKDDFLEEKCTKATKKRQKTAFFRGKIDQSSKKCPKLGVLA